LNCWSDPSTLFLISAEVFPERLTDGNLNLRLGIALDVFILLYGSRREQTLNVSGWNPPVECWDRDAQVGCHVPRGHAAGEQFLR
jgi:hypothetical protein